MSHAAISSGGRSFILAMDPKDAIEALKVAGGLAGGAFSVKLFDWFTMRRREKRKESGEWQVRVIDAGEHMREERTAEVKALRVQSDTNLERAHRAELENVTLRNENTTLRSRLDRKDEQYKVLIGQLFKLGQLPLTLDQAANWDSSGKDRGGNGRDGEHGQGIDPEMLP